MKGVSHLFHGDDMPIYLGLSLENLEAANGDPSRKVLHENFASGTRSSNHPATESTWIVGQTYSSSLSFNRSIT